MEAVCKNCDHWETDTPAVAEQQDMGECNALGSDDSGSMYVLPVVNAEQRPDQYELLTGADFGCNQFTSES